MDFMEFLKKGRRGHLVGAGGVSMSPLAEVLAGEGLVISGSDISESERTSHLRELGISVYIGHEAANITPDVEFLVRTAAARDDNPEIIRARELGIPVFERTQAWGAIMRSYRNALCIAGTHGKTTTTSMCTHILMAAEKDPTVMIGGTLPLLKAGHRVGAGDTIIMESCEYYNSFLSFYPTVAVILNIEEDHLDFFKDIEDIKKSFREFAGHVPEDGYIVANYDDENTMDAVKGLDRSVVTFGLSPRADVYARGIAKVGAATEFDIIYKGRVFEHAVIHVPGRHNVQNALAAAAACICLGLKPAAVRYGLAGFNGAGRRFEFKGKFNGADVYDDYAHHPGELKALLDAAESMGYKRTVVVFQPHTYTRTKALFGDFVRQLRRPDLVYLAEIFAAREKNILGISSADLAAEIDGARFFRTFDEIEESLKNEAQPGDLILTVGAGNVYKIGEHLLEG
ncbi:MAG: UDP-N-acetylmuramate--L-alanine ligase [Oscillospiraceae bacterium]|nr:UDP-N-acetylmuramate--L-alanine ligase [Oscillospiraceae bacterium]